MKLIVTSDVNMMNIDDSGAKFVRVSAESEGMPDVPVGLAGVRRKYRRFARAPAEAYSLIARLLMEER